MPLSNEVLILYYPGAGLLPFELIYANLGRILYEGTLLNKTDGSSYYPGPKSVPD